MRYYLLDIERLHLQAVLISVLRMKILCKGSLLAFALFFFLLKTFTLTPIWNLNVCSTIKCTAMYHAYKRQYFVIFLLIFFFLFHKKKYLLGHFPLYKILIHAHFFPLASQGFVSFSFALWLICTKLYMALREREKKAKK